MAKEAKNRKIEDEEEFEDNEIEEEDNGDEESEEKPQRKAARPRRTPPGRSQYQPRSQYQSRGRFSRRRVCIYCADKSLKIDWKKADSLHRFIADSGAIHPRRKSGLCARHQRQIAVAIKRARHLALLPYTNEHIRLMGKN